MWAKVAEEMQVPWRAAEAMHWQLGENEMARRAGVVPFSLNMSPNDPQGPPRSSPTRGHGHSQSQGSLPRDIAGMSSPRYGRGPGSIPPMIPPPMSGGRALALRRESLPPRTSFGPPETLEYSYGPPGPSLGSSYGLAPIQTTGLGPGQGRGGLLPSVAELTTGMSPYSTPAYSAGAPSASPIHSGTASPGPLLPSLSSYTQMEPSGSKRRASPDVGRETSRRRHLYPRSDDGDYPPTPGTGFGPMPTTTNTTAAMAAAARRAPRYGTPRYDIPPSRYDGTPRYDGAPHRYEGARFEP